MGSSDEMIAVVPVKELFQADHFTGFIGAEGNERFAERILSRHTFMRKGDAEMDESYKQPIPYGVIFVPGKGILVYQRATQSKDYSETRLQGKVSIGLGGHASLDDFLKGRENALLTCLEREVLKEETVCEGVPDIRLIGYLNLEVTPVDRVHFGIIYLLSVTDARLNGREGRTSWFVERDRLDSLLEDPRLEQWTRVLIPALNSLKI